jgi:hypothetical protein
MGNPRFRFVLKEGKKREIREVLLHLGYEVKRLKRVAIGPIDLGDPKVGEWRQLSVAEMNMLRDALGLSRKAKAAAGRAASTGAAAGAGAGERSSAPRSGNARSASSRTAARAGGGSGGANATRGRSGNSGGGGSGASRSGGGTRRAPVAPKSAPRRRGGRGGAA